jgi:hypothetical protein
MGELTQAEERLKLFLEYLHIEMTIMGILSAFCVAAMGLIFSSVITADKGFAPELWKAGSWYILAGTFLMALGALSFYRQRSTLAWYYGQLCLSVQPVKVIKSSTEELLEEADSWNSWLHYHLGFSFTCAALIEYGVAVLASLKPVLASAQMAFAVSSIVCAIASAVFVWWRRRILSEDA